MPLAAEEKKRMRKVFIARILCLILMILPLFAAMLLIVYQALLSFVRGKPDVFSYLVPLGFVVFCLAARKYIYPYFRNLFRYGGAQHKEVVEVTILRIRERYFKPGLPLYTVLTELATIDTGVDVVLFPDLAFPDMREGMKIRLHRVPGMKREWLRIAI